MVSQSILSFVDFLNKKGYAVNLENRYSSDSWVYDGRTIALKKCRKGSEMDWPLEEIVYMDHDILHEIGHYITAHPDQLCFPEYALILGVVDICALGPVGGEFRGTDGNIKFENFKNVSEGLLPLEEQEAQEFMTQLFCLYFGPKLGISADFCEEKFTWQKYYELKNDLHTEKIKFRFEEVLKGLL